MSPSAPAETRKPEWDRASLIFAVGLQGLNGVDKLLLSHFQAELVVMRLLWGAELVATAWWMNRLSGLPRRLLVLFNSGLATLLVLFVVARTGVLDSPYVSLVPCLPLMVGFVYAEEAASSLLSGVLCVLGIYVLGVFTGSSPHQGLSWSATAAVSTVFGAVGSVQFRRAVQARNEAQWERARRESAEKLARSLRDQAQSERLATVGRLAAGVMHEINNPLAFVQANLRFLQEELHTQPLPPKALGELEAALLETRSGVERVQQIVADLKGFSRRDTEEPRPCALADVVADAVRLAAVRLKHVARVEVDLPPGLPPVLAAPRRLVQVLLNLLVNAGDAIEESGAMPGRILVRGEVREARVRLCVEDDGPGFPPEVLPRLFETFFTTKGPEKGTGLGLVISRELLEQCGATLTAENRDGARGARMRIDWPPPPPDPA